MTPAEGQTLPLTCQKVQSRGVLLAFCYLNMMRTKFLELPLGSTSLDESFLR